MLNLENKKQLLTILVALAIGALCTVLVGNYVTESVNNQTRMIAQEFEEKKVAPLVQQIESMQREMQKVQQQVAQGVAIRGEGGGPGAGGAPVAPKSSLAFKTPPGKRAYTVMIDSLSAVGGNINPGDFVDIVGHLEIEDPRKLPEPVRTRRPNEEEKKDTLSTIVFQNIQVLAVGANLQAPGTPQQQAQAAQQARSLNVTFAMTPEEVGLLSFVERNGKMQLALRGPAETETEMVQVSSWGSLADYLFEKQGTELMIPQNRADLEAIDIEEVKPTIQIFREGSQSE